MNARILLLPEFSSMGGTRTFFEMLAGLHQRTGLRTRVLVDRRHADERFADTCRTHGLEHAAYAAPRFLGAKPYVRQCWELAALGRSAAAYRPDLLVDSTGTPEMFLGLFFLPWPLVHILHTVPEPPNWKRAPLFRALRTRPGPRKRLVTVSHFAARAIVQGWGVAPDQVDVVHNSYQRPAAAPEPHQRPTVLTLGHLVDYKDPATWLEAARLVRARVPATRLVWLGEGPLLEPMRAAAADDPDIEFAGYRQDVEVHYARADVYFQPSLRENHSIAVLDAMASGLPCVTSDRGGLPEQVQEDETGHLCPAGDADAFAARITALLQEPERARAMGAAGRERAHTLFSPQAQEQRILDIYRRVLQA